MDDKYLKKQKLNKILIALLIFIIIGIVGFPLFTYLRISADARLALREAKNVNIAFRAVITEYYGSDSVIYDPSKANGLATGVEQEIKALSDQSGDIRVTAYDVATRKVTGFIYRTGDYEVIYKYDVQNGDTWKVNYIFIVLNYDKDKK